MRNGEASLLELVRYNSWRCLWGLRTSGLHEIDLVALADAMARCMSEWCTAVVPLVGMRCGRIEGNERKMA